MVAGLVQDHRRSARARARCHLRSARSPRSGSSPPAIDRSWRCACRRAISSSGCSSGRSSVDAFRRSRCRSRGASPTTSRWRCRTSSWPKRSARAAEAQARAERLEARVQSLSEELDSRSGYGRMVGQSDVVEGGAARRRRRWPRPIRPCCSTGESGTGKEVDRALHPPRVGAARRTVRRRQLRGAAGAAARVGAVRLRARRLHRRAAGASPGRSSWPPAACCSSTKSAR